MVEIVMTSMSTSELLSEFQRLPFRIQRYIEVYAYFTQGALSIVHSVKRFHVYSNLFQSLIYSDHECSIGNVISLDSGIRITICPSVMGDMDSFAPVVDARSNSPYETDSCSMMDSSWNKK